MRPLVSVIVPVYNTAFYLTQCLDSIVNQSFKNIEIICINDGSTDESPDVLHNFAGRDKRIKIINQENKGLAVSRNVGIEAAQGKYITFVDSDDRLSPEALELMVNAAENNPVDFVIADAQAFADTPEDAARTEEIVNWLKTTQHEEGIHFIGRGMPITCWSQLLKTETLHKYNIRFPNEKLAFEDEYWRYAHRIHCKTYYYLPQKLYQYRIRGSSITGSQKKTARPLDIIRIHELIVEELQKYGRLEEFIPELERLFRSQLTHAQIFSGIKYYAAARKSIKHYLKIPGMSDDFYASVREDAENGVPFSIIVPVYNTEPYLVRCLDSLLAQSCDLYEIICIDDGSTDGSLKILQKYAAKHKNIRLITQSNSGVSSARNAGIEAAKGKYVMFVDSDDFVEPDMIETLYTYMQNNMPDWLLFQLRLYDETTDSFKYVPHWMLPKTLPDFSVYTGHAKLKELLQLPHECTNKVWRRKILNDNHIRFKTDTRNGEDELFNIEYILAASKFGALKKCFYNYRHPRKGSAVTEIKKSCNPLSLLVMVNHIAAIESAQTLPAVKQAVAGRYIMYIRWILSYPVLEIRDRYTELRQTLKTNKSILHRYKKIDEETVATARYIIKHGYFGYVLRRQIKNLLTSPAVQAVKTGGCFVKSYLLFPWYIYKTYKMVKHLYHKNK